ncbi:MAG: hypothetical protein JST19_03900 [Bacteroidetes bacterium]|nr:hypothetical protein [Bacteroidota bacterium]
MKDFDIKFRRILIPFLIISAGSVLTYSVLRWLIFIKYNLFTVDKEILNVVAPIFFVLIPIVIWLGPRIQLLDLSGETMRGTPFSGFMLLAMFAIAGPTMVAQVYLESPTENTLLWTIGAFFIGAILFMLLLLLRPVSVEVAATINKRNKNVAYH